jgi:alpha-galactosidase
MPAMSTIVVPRASFSIEDPWSVPPACQPVRLVRATDGSAPRLSTTVAAYRDDASLTFVFSATDDLVVARYYAHDEPLWEHDAVEVFLAPAALTEYFELEVNPLGTTFDARIESPDGDRRTMRTFLEWTCEGLFAAVRTEVESGGAMTIETAVRIPFASVGGVPAAGAEWRANLFRIDRHPQHGDEFTAWQPTLETPANFHVPAAFGTLRFA